MKTAAVIIFALLLGPILGLGFTVLFGDTIARACGCTSFEGGSAMFIVFVLFPLSVLVATAITLTIGILTVFRNGKRDLPPGD